MKVVGLCTHFTVTDEWAFDYALALVREKHLQLNICHWLESPYQIRRDLVYDDLFNHKQVVPVTPEILNSLELKLREYYEPKLGAFTDVAFKLCEGTYQVELIRCFRQNFLDLVVIGYQEPAAAATSAEQPLDLFAMSLPYPVIIVGKDGPETLLLNHAAVQMRDVLALPAGRWQVLEPA